MEGMIQAARYAREQDIPSVRHLPGDADRRYGVCPRRAAGYSERQFRRIRRALHGAHKVIALMPGPAAATYAKGGTMRLGKLSLHCHARHQDGRVLRRRLSIWERHRHRYEFNNEFRQEMLRMPVWCISGTSS